MMVYTLIHENRVMTCSEDLDKLNQWSKWFASMKQYSKIVKGMVTQGMLEEDIRAKMLAENIPYHKSEQAVIAGYPEEIVPCGETAMIQPSQMERRAAI